MTVFACSIDGSLEGHTLAKIVFCRVFKSLEQAIFIGTIEVDTLAPANLGTDRKESEPELGVLLVATALLALALFVDNVVSQTGIPLP